MAEPKKKLRLDELPDLLTVREVAELLRVSPRGQALQKRSCSLASGDAR
jgi:hypothetical protein